MSTTFYAGPTGNGALKQIAFRENGGHVHWNDAESLKVCLCCTKIFTPEEIVAHDEYGTNYTYAALIAELGSFLGDDEDRVVEVTCDGVTVFRAPVFKVRALISFFQERRK